jgi:hypothetical protein
MKQSLPDKLRTTLVEEMFDVIVSDITPPIVLVIA